MSHKNFKPHCPFFYSFQEQRQTFCTQCEKSCAANCLCSSYKNRSIRPLVGRLSAANTMRCRSRFRSLLVPQWSVYCISQNIHSKNRMCNNYSCLKILVHRSIHNFYQPATASHTASWTQDCFPFFASVCWSVSLFVCAAPLIMYTIMSCTSYHHFKDQLKNWMALKF